MGHYAPDILPVAQCQRDAVTVLLSRNLNWLCFADSLVEERRETLRADPAGHLAVPRAEGQAPAAWLRSAGSISHETKGGMGCGRGSRRTWVMHSIVQLI
jgi:hypothetical protein